MKIDVKDINQLKHIKSILNIMGFDVSIHSVISIILSITTYAQLGEETTIRDIGAAIAEATEITQYLKEQENEE